MYFFLIIALQLKTELNENLITFPMKKIQSHLVIKPEKLQKKNNRRLCFIATYIANPTRKGVYTVQGL